VLPVDWKCKEREKKPTYRTAHIRVFSTKQWPDLNTDKQALLKNQKRQG
jgi:hypothetical protein